MPEPRGIPGRERAEGRSEALSPKWKDANGHRYLLSSLSKIPSLFISAHFPFTSGQETRTAPRRQSVLVLVSLGAGPVTARTRPCTYANPALYLCEPSRVITRTRPGTWANLAR